MYGEGGNPFPHDGEHGADCTGYGSCDCDEKNYGYRGGGSSGGSSGDNSGCLIVVALIVASIVFNKWNFRYNTFNCISNWYSLYKIVLWKK